MDLQLQGKTALITASGRGLGRAIANRLAKEGARVIINSRSKFDLEEALQELSSLNGQPKAAKMFENASKNSNSDTLELICGDHVALCSDLTLPKAPEDLCNFLVENDLQPDIIVHNLGGNLNITNPLCSLEDWHKVMRVNIDVQILINNLLIPRMMQKRWGRICHVSSISALENHGPPSYCAAKAALTAYVRSLGRYLAKDGVVMTSILPGAVFTENGYWDDASKNRPEHVKRFLKERMAIQRFGSPDEIADIVAFLCSNSASFCVGSAFVADGGQGRSFYSQVQDY